MLTTKTLTRILQQDLLLEPEKAQIDPKCLSCGRPYLYKGPNGDNSGRFCSRRCREGFEAGAPAWDETREKNLHLLTPPLAGCRTIAGPPGTVGLNPWQSVIDASERKRRKLERRKNRKNKSARSKAYEGGDLRIGHPPIPNFSASEETA